jgi:uncharacterized protein (TIRG00374 family)
VRRRVRRAVGSLLAVALLAVVVLAVGPRAVARQLGTTDPRAFAPAPVAGLAALCCWAEAQRRLHRAAGAAVAPGRFWPAYAVGSLGVLAVPGGRAGGPLVMAYAVGRVTDLPFERDLTAASAGSYLGVASALAPALVGAAAVGAPGLLPSVLVVGAVLAAVVVALWRRPALARRAAHGLAGVGRALLAPLPGVAGPGRERVTAAIDEATTALDAIAGDRRAVVAAFVLSTLGWCLSGAALAVGAAAVGHPVAPAVAVAVVPVASVANLVPLPGGLGGVEAALAALLVAAGLPAGAALAVALLHRAATDVVGALAGAASAARP